MPENFNEAWRSQENEPLRMTEAEACARARAEETKDRMLRWAACIVGPLMIALYVRNLFALRNHPWIEAGTAAALAAIFYIGWVSFRNRVGSIRPMEACAVYLRRSFEAKRRWNLEVRRALLILIPAVMACWWGGGPMLRAKALGIHSRMFSGPAPLIVMGVLLAILWAAFSKEAARLAREIEKLGS